MGDFPFGKSRRLLNAADFSAVFSHALTRVNCPELLILARRNNLQHPRLGVVVAKKAIKLATERNRIKRLTRESFRLHQHRLPDVDIVVLVRKKASDLDNKAYARLLSRQWTKLANKNQRALESTA